MNERMKTALSAATAIVLPAAALAAMHAARGDWNVTFDGQGGRLTVENAARRVKVSGRLAFSASEPGWRVAESREAYRERICLEDGGGAVRGYVSFRGDGGRIAFEVVQRTGRNRFDGTLTFDGTAEVRADAFACRTIPGAAERVLNLADGAGDLPTNDSVFSPQDDLALRFFAPAVRIATAGGGKFAVALSCTTESSATASAEIVAEPHYYASRWAPGYRPINRRRCPRAPTGWMSWNVYFDKAGAKENLDEARVAAKYLKPFGLEIWSIESWQGNSYWLPVSTFHNLDLSCLEEQFPEGMKKLADDLRALGFRPGLWMPLYGTGDDRFYAAHKDWFLHGADGKPLATWNGKYTLDTSVPEVLDHLRRITRIASGEWGYEFFKFDGMAQKPLSESPEFAARRRSPDDRNWFANSVKAMREGVGEDRIVLGSMADFTGAEIGYLDASRLGADIASLYEGVAPASYLGRTSTARQMPIRWRNIMQQVDATFGEVFVNNIMMFTDPDTLLVNFALDRNEAEVMATVVGLPGQVMFAGDKLAELSADRMKILQQVLPVADIRPVGLYPYAPRLDVWNLKVTRPFGSWNVVALFNFGDSEKRVAASFAELGQANTRRCTAYEFWRQEWMGVVEDGLDLSVPPHTVRLVALWKAANRPQFVGDDRHLTQGAVELEDLSWDDAAGVLRADMRVVGGFPLTFAVSVPEGFAQTSVATPGMSDVAVEATPGRGVSRITLRSPETRTVPVEVSFRKTAGRPHGAE
ncbi:MAG: alpha-galactosidase [Kiritimatiellae bacterium]|nr:alpha-galactosidase [Kiritimatiellia bacterium]